MKNLNNKENLKIYFLVFDTNNKIAKEKLNIENWHDHWLHVSIFSNLCCFTVLLLAPVEGFNL